MKDIEYLKLLSEKFPDARKAGAEIINLTAICNLPKGTEYFFSDLHGEYESFSHLLRSSSGIIRAKIEETFGNLMSSKEQLSLANLIYYPRENLRHDDNEWIKITINQLISICRVVSSKYTRSKVRKKMPADYAYAIDELLHIDPDDPNKRLYYQGILNSIISTGAGETFIIALCELIQNLTIDQLHIIGDIFDRGPRADKIMNELMQFHDVDIQWGNHDISWMGAACGNRACIANVLRIATSYNSFDVLEDGYGINLRPLSMFAADVYRDDPCLCFKPHLLDDNKYDSVDPELAAKMCKAITIIQLKLEGQLIAKHPEYQLDSRLVLDRIDYTNGTYTCDGKTYPLRDSIFETIDPSDPYRLTKQEEELLNVLTYSFSHSNLLQQHIQFLYTHGSLYKICNNNLLYHGCIPLTEDGSFAVLHTDDGDFYGRKLLDHLNQKIRDAYYLGHADDYRRSSFQVLPLSTDQSMQSNAQDLMWYLWCGPLSPLFGKEKMATFEHIFIADKSVSEERFNPYYDHLEDQDMACRILENFGLDAKSAHIINGHVPVRAVDGECPVKADGKLYIIDGGLSKAYHSQTGIAGYTLIYNSNHLALAAHREFIPGGENTPDIKIVERMPKRVLVRDTDVGKELQRQISDLQELMRAYDLGLIRQK